MPVVLTGLLLNVFVISLNGGMPVRLDAVLTVDRGHTAAELRASGFDAKRHLEGPDDRLAVLGDTLPVPVVRQVLSFGDVILAFGIGNVVFRLLKPARSMRRRRRPSVAEVIAMLPAASPSSAPKLSRSA
jgi:hypothetical protein